MGVAAEVKAGERRVIEFFLDPFLRTGDESLNVRQQGGEECRASCRPVRCKRRGLSP